MVLTTSAETPVQAWVQRFANRGLNADDQAYKVVTDADANVIVAGSTSDNSTGQDILIVKYSGSGSALWTNRYTGPGNGDDHPTALAVDTNGTVFVAGYSTGVSGSFDWVTIAYSSSGNAVWTNRYSDPLWKSEDQANAMALDAIGNVVVAGYSLNLVLTSHPDDYLVIKYSPAGVALWTNSYAGPANGKDRATAVATDTAGNVFVTGYSPDIGTANDYATIKYSGSGVALWTNRFNGPGNGADQAIAIAVDTNSNVFVTGTTTNGSFGDYATIAYSSDGTALWTNFYNGPAATVDQAQALALDGSGNVFVTGFSRGSGTLNDFATIKYSGAGVALWTNRYNGTANGDDQPTAIAVNVNGQVVVTGYSAPLAGPLVDYVTVAYSDDGDMLWTNRYNGPSNHIDQAQSIAMDGYGDVAITGFSRSSASASDTTSDFATIKYSASGSAIWTNRYRGTANGDDRARAAAVDDAGNVFVTGLGSVGANTFDYVTIAYSSGGVALWTNRYNGPGNDQDYPMAMALDRSGNVFVTGFSEGTSGYRDYATIAYSGGGVPLWTNRYDGPNPGHDTPTALTADDSGRVFVTGYSAPVGGLDDYVTVAYSADGAPLWTNRYDGPANHTDRAHAIVVAGNGDIIVAGYSTAPYAEEDFLTIAYTGSGTGLWTNRYNGPESRSDQAQAVAVDKDGNVFVTGFSYSTSEGSYDYATVGYSAEGAPLWTNRYGGPTNNNDYAQAVAVDNNSHVFVTGSSYGNGSSDDYATIAYSTTGVALWTNLYNGPVSGSDRAIAIACDRDGNVFVTGSSAGGSTKFDDYATIKYSNDGVPLWTNRYNGPASGSDQPQTKSCLAIGPNGEAYVVGGSDGNYSSATAYNFAIVKYISLPEIASQPADRTNNVGSAATFRISATGSAALQYQWQRSETNVVNGGNVSGVNSNMLVLANVQFEDVGDYRVIVTNAFGSVTSAVAVLTVVAPSLPIKLSSAAVSNGVFNFTFTNTPGANFTVLTTTNVGLPLSNWTVLGGLVEISPGQFLFTDPQATTNEQRFYCVRAP